MPTPPSTLLQDISTILNQNPLDLEDKDIVLKRCFTENWFSDTLAWLLDPKGSHKLGVRFANAFVRKMAQIRTESNYYKSKSTMFRWGNKGSGKLATQLSLKNASSVREFYLAQSIGKRNRRGPRYCDVVFLDLDISDGMFVAIENKLFTTNHPGQLEEYYDLVESKFLRAKIREYVYLTLSGTPPVYKGEKEPRQFKYWLNMSWDTDILDLVEELTEDDIHPDILQLKTILKWMNQLKASSLQKLVDPLRSDLLRTAAEGLCEELARLNDGKTGEWHVEENKRKSKIMLKHSSFPKKPLYVELLPNFTITVQSLQRKKAVFEKIIVPFGVHPDQIFNLIEIAARDVCHYHFGDSVSNYLNGARRNKTTITQWKQESKEIFEYIYKHQHELKIILSSSKYIWDALERQEDNQEE